jgi:hypothetical protein
MELPVGCGEKEQTLEERQQSYFRRELKRGAGRETVRKQRGKDKAQNMGGRRVLGAWGKIEKIKKKGNCRAKVKMNKHRTRELRGKTPEERT